MKNKNLIKALLEYPLDSDVYVAGYDGATGERNWDGGVETLRTDDLGNVYIEFNELFLDNYEDEKNSGTLTSAECLKVGDKINTEPIFDWFEREGVGFDQGDRFYAEAILEVVGGVHPIGGGYVTIATESGESYGIPADLKVEVFE